MDPMLQEILDAIASYNATHSASYLAVMHTAVDSYYNQVGGLPPDIQAQVDATDARASALQTTSTAARAAGLFQRDGVHVMGLTLPWIGVGIVAALMYAAVKKGRR